MCRATSIACRKAASFSVSDPVNIFIRQVLGVYTYAPFRPAHPPQRPAVRLGHRLGTFPKFASTSNLLVSETDDDDIDGLHSQSMGEVGGDLTAWACGMEGNTTADARRGNDVAKHSRSSRPLGVRRRCNDVA